MGIFNYLNVRRRNTLLKVLGLFSFMWLVCFWLKADPKSISYAKRDNPGLPAEIINHRPPNIALPANLPQPPMNHVPNEVGIDIIAKGSEQEEANRLFRADEAKIVPGLGERGKAVAMSEEEEKTVEAVMKKEAFNLYLSDKISFNRTVPDSRDPLWVY